MMIIKLTPQFIRIITLAALCIPMHVSSGSDPATQEEFVPQWAKSAIWYQIFPERFRNGDPTNDPTMESLDGADPSDPVKAWEVHPWGSDWYELQPWEKENGEPEMWKHILRRRFGGDLQGIIDELDYIESLGINAIYLNPVFDSPSLHKYDGNSYHHIDPHFGPDPEGDKKLIATENPIDPSTWVWTSADELALKLIKEAKKRGIRVIFDGVFNHLGYKSFAFQDLIKNQQSSPYADWFTVTSWDDPEAGTTFDYEGWFGVKSLPELREDEQGIVEGPKNYIFAATERWMNPKGMGIEYGIDGWRLDVAFCVDHQFWKQWRKHVRSINPEAYMTAEIVDVPENVIPYMQGDEFDGEMNYNFAFNCAAFFFDPEPLRISATEFDKNLDDLRHLYPKGVAYVVQNLFGSHDSNRIGSHILNRGIGAFRDWGAYFNTSKPIDNPNYSPAKPGPNEIHLQKLFVIMQMTYVGAPMVYYGDEVGMWGGNDPCCRKPMIWEDLEYQDEVYLPDGTKREPDSVEINYDLLEHYKKWIDIRNAHPSLSLGDYETILADDKADAFGFKRTLEDEEILVVFNNSWDDQTLEIPVTSAKYKDLASGETYKSMDGKLKLDFAGKTAVALKKLN
jgi:cyclomaltodextrinase